MAEARSSVISANGAIISPQYCSPHSLSLEIAKKFRAIIDGKFIVTNTETDEQVFRVNRSVFTAHRRRVLCDANGKPIVTLYKKVSLNNFIHIIRVHSSVLDY